MNKEITTSQVDASLGLNACKAYEAKDYNLAMKYLIEILDVEPDNWLARFYLAVCYQKTNQTFAAQRAFRFLYDKCTDEDLRKKAMYCMQQVTGQIQKPDSKDPPEFGRYNGLPGISTR